MWIENSTIDNSDADSCSHNPNAYTFYLMFRKKKNTFKMHETTLTLVKF